jgi:hypothetical protein
MSTLPFLPQRNSQEAEEAAVAEEERASTP